MASFGDRTQALMDEFYHEWQKEENGRKSKWDILNGFSAAHQIAVVLGNFNYQVENGGISQWIYNGYFHDDAEKLTEYLEIGAKSDERCRTILDRVYKLDQYAKETGCDRDGYYYDEDGEGSSISEMINCDTFDTWYYEKCGEDNWWQVVCGIIDKVEGREAALVSKDEHDGGIAATVRFPLRVYIENAGKPEYGGFTMPLPTTTEALRPFLEKIELNSAEYMRIFEVTADIKGLGDTVTAALENSTLLDMLNELNYLAAKIVAMAPDDFEVFSAAVEAKRHCASVAELINLTDNLGSFDLQPATSAEHYGEFLSLMDQDEVAGTIEKLKKSHDSDLRDLVGYIEKLEAHIDTASYGRARAKEEDGVFTERGYLTENDDFKEVYRGPEDIPAEYRVVQSVPQAQEKTAGIGSFTQDGYVENRQPIKKPPVMEHLAAAEQQTELSARTIPAPIRKVENTDLTTLLAKMHVLGGDYAADIHHNLNVLDARRSVEYLLLMNGRHAFLTEAAHVYRRGTDSFDAFMNAEEENIDTRIFALHVTDVHKDHVIGDLVEMNVRELQLDLFNHSIRPVRIDATPKFGPDVSYTPEDWGNLEAIDRHMGAIVKDMLEVLYRTHKAPVIACDKDKVIVAKGIGKEEIVNRRITADLDEIIERRGIYAHDTDSGTFCFPVEGVEQYAIVCAPVIASGDTVGSILILSADRTPAPSASDTQIELVQAFATYLGKQLGD